MRFLSLPVICWLVLCGCAAGPDAADSQPDTAVDMRTGEQLDSRPVDALPDLVGTVYRATEFVATQPTDKLNEAWAAMVEEHTLSVLFVVTDHDHEAHRMTLELTSAWIELDQSDPPQVIAYRFGLEPVTITLQLDGLDFTVLGTFAIDLFPASVNKPFHVHGAIGSGRLAEGGQGIEELRLSGFLDEVQINDFCLHMPGFGDVNLHWFLNLAKICPDADSDEDGNVDSYLFKGVVRAVVEPNLYQSGIHPITPAITECLPHTEPCP